MEVEEEEEEEGGREGRRGDATDSRNPPCKVTSKW